MHDFQVSTTVPDPVALIAEQEASNLQWTSAHGA
jgi:hypothetical protein